MPTNVRKERDGMSRLINHPLKIASALKVIF